MTDPEADGLRPVLHFTPRSGWINDPYGLTYHRGQYHLFYQYVPGAVEWAAQQYWGHATSPDLLRWTEHPPILAPGQGDDGIWSGSLAVDDGTATIFYTSAQLAHLDVAPARTAHPIDSEWREWSKGPVVAANESPDVTTYRDPFVFRDGDTWRMIIGAGLADGRPAVLGYTSDSLTGWSFDGIVAEGHGDEPLWLGEGWECPQLFPLGDRWVLVVGVWEPAGPHCVAYGVGDLVDGQFEATSWHRLSYGPSYYAASTFVDRDGNRGLIYWLRGVSDPGGTWAGAHSAPHILDLVDDRMIARPHPQLTSLRLDEQHPQDGLVHLPSVADIEWDVDPREPSSLRLTGDGDHLLLTVAGGMLQAQTSTGGWEMPLSAQPETLRILLDGPTVEIFGAAGVLAVGVECGLGQRTVGVEGESRIRCFVLTYPAVS